MTEAKAVPTCLQEGFLLKARKGLHDAEPALDPCPWIIVLGRTFSSRQVQCVHHVPAREKQKAYYPPMLRQNYPRGTSEFGGQSIFAYTRPRATSACPWRRHRALSPDPARGLRSDRLCRQRSRRYH